MAKKKSISITLKHLTEKEHFDLQQKTLEELFKEQRKIHKSLKLIKVRKSENPELAKLKKELEAFQKKNKQNELKEIEELNLKLKALRSELKIGAEDIISEQKEINRDFTNQKAPYVEKLKIIERMITEKEFKI